MNAKEAKKILPKSEYETFEPIFMRQISRTSSVKLKQRASLSRKLRDKYRDLSKRQAADVRTRRTNEVDTSIYDRRARLFQDVIDYLESELESERHQSASKKPKLSVPSRATRAAKSRESESRRQVKDALRRMKDL